MLGFPELDKLRIWSALPLVVRAKNEQKYF